MAWSSFSLSTSTSVTSMSILSGIVWSRAVREPDVISGEFLVIVKSLFCPPAIFNARLTTLSFTTSPFSFNGEIRNFVDIGASMGFCTERPRERSFTSKAVPSSLRKSGRSDRDTDVFMFTLGTMVPATLSTRICGVGKVRSGWILIVVFSRSLAPTVCLSA